MRERVNRFIAWMALVIVMAAAVIGLSLDAALGAETPPGENAGKLENTAILAIAVAVVTVGGSWSAAYAVAKVGSAAMGAVSENPELMARSLIFVGLAEGIAIYGLIIAIMLLGKMG